MTPDDVAGAVLRRVGLALAVAAAILVVSAGLSFVLSTPPPAEPLDVPEYSREAVAIEPLRATGGVDTSGLSGSGRVVVDDEHGTDVDRAEIGPLVEALTLSGYEVQYFDEGNLSDALDGATAFVLLNPSREYDADELVDLEAFTDRGGRLLVVAEPDHRQVSSTLFGVSVSTEESAVTTVGSTYGISFGTQYLYDFEENDGNYRHVVAVPIGEGFDETDRVALDTATTVDSRRGTAVLVTPPTTRLSQSDERRSFVVGVVDGNVMALGDSSFLTAGRHNVADNERFLATIVEFLGRGEVQHSTDDTDDTDDTGDDSSDTGDTADGDGADGTGTPEDPETPDEPETPVAPETPTT